MTDKIDHFATTKGMIMGTGLGVALVTLLFNTFPPAQHPAAPEVALRVVQNPDESCGPGECVLEITYPGNSTTYVVGHEHLTLTSMSEISMRMGPVSKPKP